MKNIFKICAALLVAIIASSCLREEDKALLAPSSNGIVTADKSSIVLNISTPADNAIAFKYTVPTFSPSTAGPNSLEFSLSGTNYSAVAEYPLTVDVTMVALTHLQMNNLMSQIKAKPGIANSVVVRLKTKIGVDNYYYSNPITLSVTPFVSFIDLYLVGDATAAGWNNNGGNHAAFRNPSQTNKFYYTGYFMAGSFKLLEKLGQWQPQWGQKGGVVSVNPGGGSDPDVFSIPSAGYYTFTMDTKDLTYSVVPFTGSTSTVYSTIGVIGSSTADGWNSDQDLTKSTFNPHIWTVNGITLNVGEVKFRADNDWGVNWGGNTEYSGIATSGGPNIPVTKAGTYNIFFNDLDGSYLLVKL